VSNLQGGGRRGTRRSIVATDDRLATYACASEGVGTIHPRYDRRGSVIVKARNVPSSSLMFDGGDCTAARKAGALTCAKFHELIIITMPPEPPAGILARLGQPVVDAGLDH
jgi:hypothetical protein